MIGMGVTDPSVTATMMQLLTAMPFREYVQLMPGLAGTALADVLKEACIEAYAASFKYIYFITVAFGVSACGVSAFIGNVGRFMDNHVAVPVM